MKIKEVFHYCRFTNVVSIVSLSFLFYLFVVFRPVTLQGMPHFVLSANLEHLLRNNFTVNLVEDIDANRSSNKREQMEKRSLTHINKDRRIIAKGYKKTKPIRLIVKEISKKRDIERLIGKKVLLKSRKGFAGKYPLMPQIGKPSGESKIVIRDDIFISRIKVKQSVDQNFIRYLASFKSPVMDSKVQLAVHKKVVPNQSGPIGPVVVDSVKNRQAAPALKFRVGGDEIIGFDYSNRYKDLKRSPPSVSTQLAKVNTAKPKIEVKASNKTSKMVTSIAKVNRHRVSNAVSRAIKRIRDDLTTSFAIRQVVKQKRTPRQVSANSRSADDLLLSSHLLAQKGLDNTSVSSQQTEWFSFTLDSLNSALTTQDDISVSFGVSPFRRFNFRDGQFVVDYLGAGVRGVTELNLFGDDLIDTIMPVKLDSSAQYSVAILTREKLQEIIKEPVNLDEQAMLLVRHEYSGQATDIDSNYSAVYTLNSNFELTDDDIVYELFVGINPGLRTFTYLTEKREDIEQVFLASEGVLYFLNLNTDREQEMNVQFVEQHMDEQITVNDQLEIAYFNHPLSTYQNGNYVNFLLPPKAQTMSDYLDIKRGEEQFYVQINRKQKRQKIALISEFYISALYDYAGINDPERVCIIQYNLSSPLSELELNARDKRGSRLVRPIYLDSDGNMYDELGANSRYAFAIVDRPSIVHLVSKNMQGGERVTATFCAPGSYFISNL